MISDPKQKNKDAFDIRLRQLDELQFSMAPKLDDKKYPKFAFQIRNEIKIDGGQNSLAVLVHVEVKSDDQSMVLASFSLLHVYDIINFNQVIQVEHNGKLKIPQHLLETLLQQSIASTRGLMYGHLKGTYLQGALLPLIQINEM